VILDVNKVCCPLLFLSLLFFSFSPFRFPSSSCILACWQVIFDDQSHSSPQKKLKVHYFCNNSYVFSFFFFSLLLYTLQNEQIFNRICTKESDSPLAVIYFSFLLLAIMLDFSPFLLPSFFFICCYFCITPR
jgi:hypothetical protein